MRKVINFEIDVVTNAHQGVLILGKFQYVRSRNICLDELNIEGKFQNCSVILLPSLNGKTFDAPVTPAIVEDESTLKSYTSRLEAKNCAVAVKGQFSIDSLELTFHPGSAR